MPVPMAKMFGSRMTSSGSNPTTSVSSRYARVAIATLRSAVSAWPCSSKAMTTTAAPYRRHSRACSRNGSSPSLSEMELTTPRPWMHLRPASMTSQRDESSITGTVLMSGSDAMRFRNRVIAATESSIASSMFTSMSWAPASTCWRATSTASS